MEQLKKCPFCGGENIHSTYFNWTPAIMCECGAVMTVQMGFGTNKEAELVRRWNTRKPLERIVERLEETKGKDIVFCPPRANGKTVKLGQRIGLDRAIEIVKEEM